MLSNKNKIGSGPDHGGDAPIVSATGEVHSLCCIMSLSFRELCERLYSALKGGTESTMDGDGLKKRLDAPVHLGSMAASMDVNIGNVESIWFMKREDTLVCYSRMFSHSRVYANIRLILSK